MYLHHFHYTFPFTLESGKILSEFHLAYHTYGTLNKNRTNAIWFFHAFTGNSNPMEWWNGLIGNQKVIDPEKYFIICVNMPGSYYGSTNPLSVNPDSGEMFFHDFPFWTTRDMIRAFQKLKNKLQIHKTFLGIGGSMGGQQLLEWAIEEPDFFEFICPIATNAKHSPWGIAFNFAQRSCIENDPTWKNKNSKAGINGLKTARTIALLSYRSYEIYQEKQNGLTRETQHKDLINQQSNAESYQIYQAEQIANRFSAFSYYFLSLSMDKHDVGRNRGGLIQALNKIQAKTLIIGMKNDNLFPESEQKFLRKHIQNSDYVKIDTLYGHDGFLIETEKINIHLKKLMALHKRKSLNCDELIQKN